MIVSGHQPTYLPWLGLFHKLSLCDVFVYMDTVQYLSKDWNNRNKIRTPHGSTWLTVPVDKKRTTGKFLNEIYIKSDKTIDEEGSWQKEHLMNLKFNYGKTPYFNTYFPEIENMYSKPWDKLVDLCWEQFELFRKWLHLDDKKVVRMSEVHFEGYKDDLVKDHCLKLGGNKVVFGQLGRDYVDVSKFNHEGIKVYFQEYKHPEYPQRFSPFQPYMCILDLLFNQGEKSMEVILSGNDTYEELKSDESKWL